MSGKKLPVYRIAGIDGEVDDDGQGEILFHGTADPFDTFDDGLIGTGGHPNTAMGHFFTDSPAEAAKYAEEASREGGTPRVLAARVVISNPDHSLSDSDTFFGGDRSSHAMFSRMRVKSIGRGHDGTYLEYGDFTYHVAYSGSRVTIMAEMLPEEARDLQQRWEAAGFPRGAELESLLGTDGPVNSPSR